MRQQDINTALTAYVESGNEEPWREVIQAIRSGHITIEASVRVLKLKVAPSPARAHLAKRLGDLRNESGLGLQEIADAMGVSISSVIRHMHGIAIGHWPTISMLITTLGGDPAEYWNDWKAAKGE